MKKRFILIVMLICLFISGCRKSLIEGTEKTYTGIVTDIAMSKVHEQDLQGRAYISISTEQEELLFWLYEDTENKASLNDEVIIESAIEKETGLLVAYQIIVK